MPSSCTFSSTLTCNEPAVYGTLGAPAAGDNPGSRVGSTTWTDKSGNLWLFGGSVSNSAGDTVYLNDLWQFAPSTGEWTWMGGSNTGGTCTTSQGYTICGAPGVYGTAGVAASTSFPGGRWAASSWTDSSGDFWLLGGAGFDSGDQFGFLNDLWRFDPAANEWTWMSGNSTIGDCIYTCGRAGVYGTLGSFAPGNQPGGRYFAVSWIDPSGNFWLHGGNGYDSQDTYSYLNDLWKYDPAENEWEWVNGSNTNSPHPPDCGGGTPGANGVYGTLDVFSADSVPGGRADAVNWIDHDGNLWLFGGYGCASAPSSNLVMLNDLWEFQPSLGKWAWMGGSSTIAPGNFAAPGVYGSLGVSAPGNVPGGRNDAASWTDATGKFWMFGGYSDDDEHFNDLWEFDPSTSEWAWMDGSNAVPVPNVFGAAGVYGQLGVASPENSPGARSGANSWTDSLGNAWLFGGAGLDSNGTWGVLNDLWKYQPYAIIAPSITSVSETTFTSGASGTFKVTTTGSPLATLSETGALPSGVTFTDNGNGTATLAGKSAAANTYPITITANNGVSPNATQNFTLTMSSVGLTSPTPGSVLGSSNVQFTWAANAAATQYNLWLGLSGPGSSSLYTSGWLTTTSTTVSSIPAHAATVYARLYSMIGGKTQYNDYTFTEAGTPAAMSTPAPGATLGTSNMQFTWTAGYGVTQYNLWLGLTGAGSSGLYTSGWLAAPATATSVTSLPGNGATVYARLYSTINGKNQYVDYTYTEGESGVPATMTTPTAGSTLGTSNVQFTWSKGTNVTQYQLWLGLTGAGSSGLYTSGWLTTQTTTVPSLPAKGATVYARLYSTIGGKNQYIDYTYTEQ